MKRRKNLSVLIVLSIVLATIFPIASPNSISALSEQEKNMEIVQSFGLIIGGSEGITEEYLGMQTTRLQLAIVCLRLNGLWSEAQKYEGEAAFKDKGLSSLASKVTGYLKDHPELGWIGDSNGYFNPDKPLSTKEFYKVMLVMLGYEYNADFNWNQVVEFAEERKLVTGNTGASISNATFADWIARILKSEVKSSEPGKKVRLIDEMVKKGIADSSIAERLGLIRSDSTPPPAPTTIPTPTPSPTPSPVETTPPAYPETSENPPVPVLTYQEDFDDDAAQNWTLPEGISVSGGSLHSDRWDMNPIATYDDIIWTGDYTYKVDVNTVANDNGNRTKLIFNYSDNQNYYLVDLGGGLSPRSFLRKVAGGTTSTLAANPAQPSISGDGYTTIEIRYESAGFITVLATKGDVTAVLFNRVQDTAFTTGKIGVTVTSSASNFDNVSVVNTVPAPLPPDPEPEQEPEPTPGNEPEPESEPEIALLPTYEEDFSDNEAQDWGELIDNMSVGNNRMSLENWSGHTETVYEPVIWNSSYTYKVDVNTWGGGNGNKTKLLFGYSDSNNYYFVEIGAGSSPTVSLKKRIDGTESTVETVTSDLNIGVGYTTIEIKYEIGGYITVQATKNFVTQIVIERIQDVSLSFGKIGVGVQSSGANFDNISVVPVQDIFPSARNKYLWPFAEDSIWNTPIGSNAEFSGPPVPADKIQPPNGFDVDTAPIVINPGSPLRKVFAADWPIVNPPLNTYDTGERWPISDNYIATPGDGDWSGDMPNNMGAIVLQDGNTIQEYNYFGRFTPGGNIYIAGDGIRSTQDIRGSGQPSTNFFGGHGGSGLSSFGGMLRLGELTSAETKRIRHVLQITIDTSRWAAGEKDENGNIIRNLYRWPAIAADTNLSFDAYGINAEGYEPFLQMGSLLAIPSDEALSALLEHLETTPAKKLAWTLRYYGAYIVDAGGHNSGWGQNLLNVEYGVRSEMREVAGIEMGTWDPDGWDDTAWNRDLVKIFTELREVTNNSPESIGGGGIPLQPLAPPIYN